MIWTASPETPKAQGWYVVRIKHSDRPIVLWWSALSTQWRDGARLANVVEWSGPIE